MKKSVRWLTPSVFSLVLVFSTTMAYSSSTTTLQANGVSAMTTACLNNCSSQLFLNLVSNKTGGTTTWSIFFALSETDSSGNFTSISGSGPIPASMISGNENNNLTLDLDTNAAGLQVQECVADQNFNFTCTPFSGGVITVNWQATSLFTNHIVQQNQNTFGPVTVHNNSQSDVSSATAQSNAFGTQFVDPFAQLGNTHQGTVEITKP